MQEQPPTSTPPEAIPATAPPGANYPATPGGYGTNAAPPSPGYGYGYVPQYAPGPYGPGYGSNPWLAMPDLRVRTAYSPQGLADPSIAGWLPKGAVLMAAVAGFCVLLARLAPAQFPRPFTQLLLPVVCFMLASLFTIRVIDRAKVQTLWVAALVNLLFAAVFLAVLSLSGYSLLGPVTPSWAQPPEQVGIRLLIEWIVLGCLGTGTSMSDARRVFYRAGRNWAAAEEHRAYFQRGSADVVLAALERGDAATLAALRIDRPSAAHAWQRFTVLTLSVCRDDPTQPAYLHLKNVTYGGGIVYATRHYNSAGKTALRHTRLIAGDMDRLRWLVPDLFVGQRAIAGQAAQRGGGTPLGLPAGAPPHVESPAGSFVQRVAPGEDRNFRIRGGFFMVVMLGALAMVFGGLIPVALLDEKNKTHVIILAAYAIATFVALVTGLVLGISSGSLGRRWLSSLVARRPHRLFTPDADTFYLTIEESRTFQKMKAFPDDCGLLQAVPGMLLFEAGSTRARLMAPDVELACDQCNTETSLRISARLGDYEWAITVRDPGKSGVMASFGSSRKRAEDLWRRIYERLMGPVAPGW